MTTKQNNTELNRRQCVECNGVPEEFLGFYNSLGLYLVAVHSGLFKWVKIHRAIYDINTF